MHNPFQFILHIVFQRQIFHLGFNSEKTKKGPINPWKKLNY